MSPPASDAAHPLGSVEFPSGLYGHSRECSVCYLRGCFPMVAIHLYWSSGRDLHPTVPRPLPSRRPAIAVVVSNHRPGSLARLSLPIPLRSALFRLRFIVSNSLECPRGRMLLCRDPLIRCTSSLRILFCICIYSLSERVLRVPFLYLMEAALI